MKLPVLGNSKFVVKAMYYKQLEKRIKQRLVNENMECKCKNGNTDSPKTSGNQSKYFIKYLMKWVRYIYIYIYK